MPLTTLTNRLGLQAGNNPVPAVLYARVSSKDQEREGFSIPAQQRLLRDYASAHGLVITQEFVDVETAKASGRTGFNEMLTHLRKQRATCRTILVEKTDRLYRNIKDWATLDEYAVTIHFVKENVIISPDSRSSEQFIHGIKVLMARNYSLNLGEETLKGMTEKARAGIYPSYAPVGYRNAEGPEGKRILTPDPTDGPVITRLFREFATGEYSVKTLAQKARSEGWMLRRRSVYTSELHAILRKRTYSGDFDWNGTTYRGTHEPLVTREVWERVQQLLDHRSASKTHTAGHDFAFSGLVQCGHCGCALVGEVKKGRYVYYHCTGNRGKCPEPYTREEVLTGQFALVLQDLVIPRDILTWLQEEVVASDRSERAAREQVIARCQEDIKRLESRFETMYLDKLEGRIGAAFFDEKAAQWREQQQQLLQKIDRLRSAVAAPLEEAIDIMALTSRSSELFLEQRQDEQRRLLGMLVERATWKHRDLEVVLTEPFEQLRRSNRLSHTKESGIGRSGQDLEIWLPR